MVEEQRREGARVEGGKALGRKEISRERKEKRVLGGEAGWRRRSVLGVREEKEKKEKKKEREEKEKKEGKKKKREEKGKEKERRGIWRSGVAGFFAWNRLMV